MKRQVTANAVAYLTGLYASIITDICIEYPDLTATLTRDRERITALATTRGLPFFLGDLPRLDKLLLAALERGAYCASGEALTRPRHRRGTIPLLFEGLYLRIFNGNGCLLDDPDVFAVACLRQLFCCCKKFVTTHTQGQIDEKLIEFAEIEESLPEPTCQLWSDPLSNHPGTQSVTDLGSLRCELGNDRGHKDSENHSTIGHRELNLVQRVFDIVCCELGPYEPMEYRFRHGPGAVSDLKSGSFKYDFSDWSEQLNTIYPISDYGFINYNHWVDSITHSQWTEREPCSKIVAVPKDFRGPRLIAAEPVAHQWCQQNIRDYFATNIRNTRLSRFITLEDQSRNGRLALESSKTREYVTADLSSASDCVTTYIIERLFRKNEFLLRALAATRTPTTKQAISEAVAKDFKLKKFSTMGSACTFPVETILFTALGLASLAIANDDYNLSARRLWDRYRSKLSVYGDDIVIDAKAWGILEQLLNLTFFRVNSSKTFSEGNFRESCGVDAFLGENVTPCRFNVCPSPTNPETILSAIDSSNNFHESGWWRTADYIKHSIDGIFLIPIGQMSSGQPVFRSYTGTSVQNAYWHRDTCTWRTRATTIRSKSDRRAQAGLACALQWFTENPSQDLTWASGVSTRPRLKLNRKGYYSITDL